MINSFLSFIIISFFIIIIIISFKNIIIYINICIKIFFKITKIAMILLNYFNFI